MDKGLYDFIVTKQHHQYRKDIKISFDKSLSPVERMTYRFETLSKAETPVLLNGENSVF